MSTPLTDKEMKIEFLNIVSEKIKRNGIENLITYLEESDFFTAPASTKYHLSYIGGLLEHSLNVYYETVNKMIYYYGKDWSQRYSEESVAIVSLFHDLCKIGRYKTSFKNVKNPITGNWYEQECFIYNDEYMNMGHGAKSISIIMDYISLTEDEKSAIFWHMGPFDVGNYNTMTDCANCYRKNTLAFILHEADMSATYIVENENFQPIDLESVENDNDSAEIKN